jgi:hypothetical protein
MKCGKVRAALIALAAHFGLLATAVQAAGEQRFPDVVDVKVTARSAGMYDFDVTVSSPYDTPARYADAFRVATESGQVLGERKLLHDHQGEQPFTRDLYGVKVPASVTSIVVQARDRKYGYGGKSMRVKLPQRGGANGR